MNLFKKHEIVVPHDPVIGNFYTHTEGEGNPFEETKFEVIDIKSGWVQYVQHYKDNDVWRQCRPSSCKVTTFKNCYTKQL